MEKVFLPVLNMSLTASFVIAAIMLARLPLKKAPKIISYALWAVAGFRLVFPFTLEGVFSLVPFKSQPIPQDIAMQTVPRIDSGITVIDNAVSAALPAAAPIASANPLQIWIAVGSYIWFFGIAIMLIYSLVSIVLLKRRLRSAAPAKGNLFEADNLKTPFVIGLLRPKIYIPTGLSDEERRYIIMHEQTHIRRYDHIVKMFAYFVLCLHWFNPLAWAAFVLMGADMEMSCDERVMRELGGNIKNAYSMSLVRVAAGRKILNGSPLAFGEGGMKERIKNVLKFKKTSAVTITTAAILAIALFLGCAVSKADVKFNSYVYDDSDRNVKFSIEYPENWNVVEQRGWDGDETREASPDTGIQFQFSKSEPEIFTIAAMRFSTLYFPQEGYEAEEFTTDNNLKGIKYTDSDENHTAIFYIFGAETDSPPHYFASVSMSTQVFEEYKLAIEKVMKSFEVLASAHIGSIDDEGGILIEDDVAIYVQGRKAVHMTIEGYNAWVAAGENDADVYDYAERVIYTPIGKGPDERMYMRIDDYKAWVAAGERDADVYDFAVPYNDDAGVAPTDALYSETTSPQDSALYTNIYLAYKDKNPLWSDVVSALTAGGFAYIEDEGTFSINDPDNPNMILGGMLTNETGDVRVVDLKYRVHPDFLDGIVDGSIIRITDFEMGNYCVLNAEVLTPTGEIYSSSGAAIYEVVGNTRLVLSSDVLVSYIDYESDSNRNVKKLISYLSQGGSYNPEPTIAMLIVSTDDGENITELTEIYMP